MTVFYYSSSVCIVKVQIISPNDYNQKIYSSSSGTIITGNFIQLAIFNFYQEVLSSISLEEDSHLISSTYTNQIPFRMIY